MTSHALTDEQIKHYRTEGYVVVERVFDDADLAAVDRTVMEMTEAALASQDHSSVMELEPDPVDGRRVPRRIYNPFHQHDTFRHMATDDRVLDRIESLVGPDIQIQHSKLNMKPARVGSVVEWHQDLIYFPHTNDDLVTMLVYLDDATEHNGCLQVLPRHHTTWFDHALEDGSFAGMITEAIDERFDAATALEAPAGSLIFMHPITPHTSLPNRSDKPRRTLIFEYRAADAFPIYFGSYVAEVEQFSQQVRGNPSHTARFGGPPPVIPHFPQGKSLYQLQEQAKAQRG